MSGRGSTLQALSCQSSGLTGKDLEDLRFGAATGVDFIALSFVQSAADWSGRARPCARRALRTFRWLPSSSVRRRWRSLDDILRASDAVMVARGDLGLELPLERVPRIQKQATSEARALGIPVIVATQVLESMRTEPRPTRAEVSDAANAVDDRVDAIMLAGETAIGAHPVRVVETLDRIIREAESTSPGRRRSRHRRTRTRCRAHGRAICDAALTLAQHAAASAIVAMTRGGKTARVLSALRPPVPIVAVTDRDQVARRLMLQWGVLPVVADLSGDVGAVAASTGPGARHTRRAIPANAVIVLVSVTPDLAPGPSNFLKLHRVRSG